MLPEHMSDLKLCFRDLSHALKSDGIRQFGLLIVKTYDVNTQCADELAETSAGVIRAVDLRLANFRREPEFVQMVAKKS